jgi:hypothetical protein
MQAGFLLTRLFRLESAQFLGSHLQNQAQTLFFPDLRRSLTPLSLRAQSWHE